MAISQLSLAPARLKLLSPITSLCYNADGTRLAIGQVSTARRHPTLTWLDPSAPKQAHVLCYSTGKDDPAYGDGGITGVLAQAGKLLYVEMRGSTGGHLLYQLWDPATGQTETLLTRPSGVQAYLLPQQGSLLVLPAVPTPRFIPEQAAVPAALYDLRELRTVTELPTITGWRWQIDDAQHLLAFADQQPLVRRYALDTWAITQEYHMPMEGLIRSPAIAYTSANYCYAIGNPATGVHVWEKHTGQLLSALSYLREQFAFSACLSHDETMLAVGGQQWVTISDVASGNYLYRERLHRGRVQALAFSPDDAYLTSGAEHGDVCVSKLTPLA